MAIGCGICAKTFRTQSGKEWHVQHIHSDLPIRPPSGQVNDDEFVETVECLIIEQINDLSSPTSDLLDQREADVLAEVKRTEKPEILAQNMRSRSAVELPQHTSKNNSASDGMKAVAASTIKNGLHPVVTRSNMDSAAFFDVDSIGASLLMKINTAHPAFRLLDQALNDVDETSSPTTMMQKLRAAQDALRLLIESWARYEDSQPVGPRRERVKEARIDWGRNARSLLLSSEDEVSS